MTARPNAVTSASWSSAAASPGWARAIRLAQHGRDDFLVVERGSEVGGTWRDNTYPGAACDVPSHLYSYSFELNPNWSRSFSPQPEIQQYLRDTAQKYGVLDKHLFDTDVTRAAWDATTDAVARRHHERRVQRERPGRRRRCAGRAGPAGHQGHRQLRRRDLPLRPVEPRRRPRRASASR